MGFYKPTRIGPLVLPGNVFLAPVAGYSDRAFRTICVEQGADFTYTELVSSEALVRGVAKTDLLLERGENEERYAIQLFGVDPETMARAAALLAPYKPSVVDINCGCPVPKVIKTGAGSALLRNPALLGRIVSAVVRASEASLGAAPVTVKIRSGWDGDSINYREIARVAVEAGAAAVALHARTRSQLYEGKADWSHIADLVSRLGLPVIGSGDLWTPESAERMFRETGCQAVMFARGAMGNPFIFAETRSLLVQGSYTPMPPTARIAAGFRQLRLLSADVGEAVACREMRKHFCAYTKGLSGGAALREKLVHAETISEYKTLLIEAGALALNPLDA
jgi:nifR3 family TIM-barrel protein